MDQIQSISEKQKQAGRIKMEPPKSLQHELKQAEQPV